MIHRDLTERVLGIFYSVYDEIGHGFLESVYETALSVALRDAGMDLVRQRSVPVLFRGQVIGDFRADIIVADRVVLEVKAARAVEGVHEAQLINYLRASHLEVGLLLNFGPRATFRRLIYTNERKHSLAAGPRLSLTPA